MVIPSLCLGAGKVHTRGSVAQLKAIAANATGDLCSVYTDTHVYHYRFDSAQTSLEALPGVVKPNDSPVGTWLLISAYMTIQDVEGLSTALSGKADLVTGTVPLNQLPSSVTVAEQNVQPNWTQANTASDDYIRNRPNIVTGVSASLPLTSTGGTTPIIALPASSVSSNGYMTPTQVTKLNGIASGANLYVHPSSDGTLHVPVTSTTNNGNVLTAGATAGVFSWQPPTVASTTSVPEGTNLYYTEQRVSANPSVVANTAKVSYTPATPGPFGEETPSTGRFTSITANVVTIPIPDGSTGELQLPEDPVNPGGNVVGFKAPANLTGDMLWVLMSIDGNPGDCLKTTGSGVLYFAACSP